MAETAHRQVCGAEGFFRRLTTVWVVFDILIVFFRIGLKLTYSKKTQLCAAEKLHCTSLIYRPIKEFIEKVRNWVP